MATWVSPVPHRLVLTNDSQSFNWIVGKVTGVPIESHCGAFGVVRKYHCHEGIDLYVPKGTPVNSVNRGVVVAIEPFTGPQLNQPWWYNTWAVFVETEDGVIVYGEIRPVDDLKVGMIVSPGEVIGHVLRVLVEDKGRPLSMLHLELHKSGSRSVVEWNKELRLDPFEHTFVIPKPDVLLDPTPFLIETVKKYYP